MSVQALCIIQCAHITPHVFMHQMMEALKSRGVEFLSATEVNGIEEQSSSGVMLSLKEGQTMKAKNVVVATGSWSGKLLKKAHLRLPMQDGKGYSMTLQQRLCSLRFLRYCMSTSSNHTDGR